MRTPLVCRLSVMISPWNSWPDFLKEPMLAMSLLLTVFELRDHRGLDGDLKAEGDRRRTPWAAAQRRMAAGRLSCLARNGRSPGEESLAAAIAVQAIEAQPAFGQIKPMRGTVLACAEQHLGDVPAIDRPTQEIPRSRRRK